MATTKSGIFLFPFAAMFGGVAQFAAAMWSYRARDALATAMFGMFGSFWVAYGILNLLAATKTHHAADGQVPRAGVLVLGDRRDHRIGRDRGNDAKPGPYADPRSGRSR